MSCAQQLRIYRCRPSALSRYVICLSAVRLFFAWGLFHHIHFCGYKLYTMNMWHPWRNWFYSTYFFEFFFLHFHVSPTHRLDFVSALSTQKLFTVLVTEKLLSLAEIRIRFKLIQNLLLNVALSHINKKTQSHSLEYQFIQRAKKFAKRSSWSHEEISINVTANRRKGQHEWHNES